VNVTANGRKADAIPDAIVHVLLSNPSEYPGACAKARACRSQED